VYAADNKSRQVVDWYLDGNPELVLFGTTATPRRTDGVAMANLFDHVSADRDILWGISNGWLVPGRQAFVRVSIDFSSLSVKSDEDGEKDYSDAEIAAKINNEQTLIELAKGIVHVAGPRKSIVICPDVASAKAVAHYLDGERPRCSRCIYGAMSDQEKDAIFASYADNDFQFLVSVMMLTKGFDSPDTSAVFMCRKTKSKRLYEQCLGRGTRPLKGVVDDPALDTPEKRRAAIAASGKPDMLMVNMVGIEEWVRDMSLVDVLGTPGTSDEVKQMAKKKQEEQPDLPLEEAMQQAKEEVEAEQDAERMLAEAAAAETENDDVERDLRRRLQVNARVDVEYEDGLTSSRAAATEFAGGDYIPQNQLNILNKAKVPPEDIAKLTADDAKRLSREIVRRWKMNLCSYRQAKALRRFGYTKDQVENVTFAEAKAILDDRYGNKGGGSWPDRRAVTA
jgi:superfamily II DNA or RNA helicase